MPSLKADGSLRPDTLWKLRSPPLVLVSIVDLDIPENLCRKAEGTRLLLAGACLMTCWSLSVWSSPVSWRAPLRLRLWRRIRSNTMARISAAPARLPTMLPTTCGVCRGAGLLSPPASATAAVVAAGGAAVFPTPPPPP